MDLEGYATFYAPQAAIHRLYHIANFYATDNTEDGRAIARKALKLSISLIKKGLDVPAYRRHAKLLSEIDDYDIDEKWIDLTSRRGDEISDKLESELATYRNNLIKESIRLGHLDLGDHYVQTGRLNDAVKIYIRAREYSNGPQHLLALTTSYINASLLLKNYQSAHTYANKVLITLPLDQDKKAKTYDKDIHKLHIIQAIGHMDSQNYRECALALLKVDYNTAASYPEAASASDVASFIVLCALASFDRNEIKEKIINNTAVFKDYAALEPQMRDIVTFFDESKYGECFTLLDANKPSFMVDIYLHSHVNNLFELIHERAIVQYFSAFKAIELSHMATVFGTNTKDLRAILVKLIRAKKISGKIDSERGVIVANPNDPKLDTHQKALNMGAEYYDSGYYLLHHINVIKAGLEISDIKKDENQANS